MKRLVNLSISIILFVLSACNSSSDKSNTSSIDSLNLYTSKSEDYNLVIDSITLSGTLNLPDNETPCEVVLIIAGSGPTDRNGNNSMGMTTNIYKMLADTLAYHGFASLRYDKRGIAKSAYTPFNEMDLTFDRYVNDAVEWIKKLKSDKRFKNIIVLGHSEGSLIGMLASDTTEVKAFISVAGPAQSADSLILIQISEQMSELKNEVEVYLKKLKKGERIVVTKPELLALFRPTIQPYLINWFKYDPKDVFSKLTIPTLVIQGTTDIQVDYKNAEILAQYNKTSELKIIEGMNHILKIADSDTTKNLATYKNGILPLSTEFCEDIINFLESID